MRKYQKLLSVTLAVSMMAALAACGQQAGTGGRTQEAESRTAQSAETTEDAAAAAGSESAESAQAESTGQEAAEDAGTAAAGKALVVYYSASGNTETVAGYIAQALDADTFEITPAEIYTDEDLNWTNADSRVSREHEDESLRDVPLVTTTVENWEAYDTVFIGYPIWWGIAAWPVDGFVSANDFTGKTVIPFCTSASSGLGESGALLAELAGTGDWQEGERFRSSASQADVTAWVESLGLEV